MLEVEAIYSRNYSGPFGSVRGLIRGYKELLGNIGCPGSSTLGTVRDHQGLLGAYGYQEL